LGTIILNQEYRELHPLEETKKAEKKPKIPKGNLKNKITRKLFDFFGDENEMT
jgi:hypothetical protein